MRNFILVLLAVGLCGVTYADEPPLRKLLTADDAKAWQAVGRINMDDAGFCTGSLIATNLVLTAAHCMFHPTTGEKLQPEDIEFLAGWRSGRAVAQRQARRIVVNKNYKQGRAVGIGEVRDDIALIELEHPITTNAIEVFDRGRRPQKGEAVKVVSYAENRSEAPSIEEVCTVLTYDPRALVLTCDVDHGASGSPVFVIENGVPKIVSVVSAKAIVDDQKVALGASLGEPLQNLIDQLSENRGVFLSIKPVRKSIGEQLGKPNKSAKILRP